MKNLLLLLATVAVFACSKRAADDLTVDNPNRIDEYEEPAVEPGTVPAEAEDLAPQNVLDAVAQSGGLTKLPLGLANRIIDGYLGQLAGVPAAATLVPDLELVRAEINSGIISRADVGAALQRLGAQTRLLAADDASYSALGTALKLSGDQLVGEE